MHIEKDYKRQVVQIMEKLNSFYKMLKNNAEKYPNKEAIICPDIILEIYNIPALLWIQTDLTGN